MLRLYDNHASTNALKVRMLLEELALECERIEVVLDGPKPADYGVLHPFGLVPVLTDGDVVLTESNVALRYLAEREGRTDLRGTSPAERARIDGLLDSLSLELRPALWGVEEFAIYGGVAGDESERIAALEAKLAAYDRLLDPDGPWATGARFTIADCALGGRALHLPRLPLAPACAPRLRRVLAGLAQRPSFRRATAESDRERLETSAVRAVGPGRVELMRLDALFEKHRGSTQGASGASEALDELRDAWL